MQTNKFTFFWRGPFSQWHTSDFYETVKCFLMLKFFCMEQFMMAKKALLFDDTRSSNTVFEKNG